MPASETITVALEGSEIPLSSFVEAISALNALLKDLSAEVAPGADLAWNIQDLQAGSATATIRGDTLSGDPDSVGRVSAAYEAIGDALSQDSPFPYSRRVQRRVTALTAVLNHHVPELRLETANREFLIREETHRQHAVRRPVARLGAIRGRVQTLSNRGGLRFTLYDTLDDRAVACYLKPGEESRIQMPWGRRVIVEGEVYRDPWTGRPTAIRQITDVVELPEYGPDAWRDAIGAMADVWDGEPAEVTIRRIRDAG